MRKEYVDTKHIRHRVEHLTLPADDQTARARILDDLLHILAGAEKQTPI